MTSGTTTLKRSLNTPLLTLYGLGVTVGAGIYVLIGEAAALAGPFAWLSFLAAAIVVGFTALSYTELSTRYPISAGEAVYVEKGFGRPMLATGVGMLVAFSGMVSAAAIAVGASGYLAGLIAVPDTAGVVPIVLLMGILAWWGITQSVTTAAVVTVLELLGLMTVIYWGFSTADTSGLALSDMMPTAAWSDWNGIIGATVLAFFAFVGFEDMVNVAEEVKDPRRTLPRAILITLVVATVLYVATCLAVLMSVPLDELATSGEPLALVFADAPVVVQSGFSALAIVATVNGVLIQIIMSSRIFYGIAARGNLPAAFARLSPRTRTPTVATGFVTLAIIVLASLFPIGSLASWTSQIVLVVFVLVNASLIAIKSQGQDRQTSHFDVPLLFPIAGLILSLTLLAVSLL